MELWALVLKSLCSITIKAFRLVCRQWARIGVEWLFHTVHVDCYSKSWERLEQLSHSQYGRKARVIVWKFIELPESPVDAIEWAQSYPNILTGAKHITVANLYDAYRRCIKNNSRVQLDPEKRPSVSFSGLPNLQQFTIEDEPDLETRCRDLRLRAHVQQNTMLAESVAMWGLCPPVWPVRDYDDDKCTGEHPMVFLLLRNCLSLASCRINLWDSNWRHYVDKRFNRRLSEQLPLFGHPKLTNMELIFKYCNIHIDTDLRYNYQTSAMMKLGSVFQSMNNFPELESLSIKPCFKDPGSEITRAYEKALYDQSGTDESDDDCVCQRKGDECECFYEGSSVSEIDAPYRWYPPDVHPTFERSLDTIFHPGVVDLPKLRTLEVHDAVVDLSCLVGWLCQQTYHNQSLKIFFRGHVLLHGLSIWPFRKLASHLGAQIICDETVICYDTKSTNAQARREGIYDAYWSYSRVYQYLYGLKDWLEVRDGFDREEVEMHIDKLEHFRAPFLDCGSGACIEAVERPLSVLQLLAKGHWNNISSGMPYHLCMELHHNGIIRIYWTDQDELREKVHRRSEVHILLSIRRGKEDRDPYGPAYHEVYEDTQPDELEVQFMNAQEQELLRVYEVELLGLDRSTQDVASV